MATAPICSLAQELPYAAGAALKSKTNKKTPKQQQQKQQKSPLVLRVQSESPLPACATAIATWDVSHVCDLHPQLTATPDP